MKSILLRTAKGITGAGLITVMISCANFKDLDADLTNLEESRVQLYGQVIAPGNEDQPTVMLYMSDIDGKDMVSFRVMSKPGGLEVWTPPTPVAFFAFSDLNRDLTFQASEPYGWFNKNVLVDPVELEGKPFEITILPNGQNNSPPPGALVGKRLGDISVIHGVNFGVIAKLDDPQFSQEEAETGLWQPYAFIEEGYAGIYLLESYDPQRIPVVFVHGINGTPRSFAPLIDSLDQTKYQAWFMYYPSGLWLDTVSLGLFEMMEVLHGRFRFDRVHMIAHSMGGLVTRGFINECASRGICDYLASFTSIATPWEGAASAELGIKYAPTVVPVWNDMAPSGDYLATLFDQPAPDGMPVNLLFSFKRGKRAGKENTDGAVALSSQLRHPAQLQADLIMGFNESHVGVLSDPHLLETVQGILAAADADQ
jgi:pimeloyl-ACP methyl ester carboxylesterase